MPPENRPKTQWLAHKLECRDYSKHVARNFAASPIVPRNLNPLPWPSPPSADPTSVSSAAAAAPAAPAARSPASGLPASAPPPASAGLLPRQAEALRTFVAAGARLSAGGRPAAGLLNDAIAAADTLCAGLRTAAAAPAAAPAAAGRADGMAVQLSLEATVAAIAGVPGVAEAIGEALCVERWAVSEQGVLEPVPPSPQPSPEGCLLAIRGLALLTLLCQHSAAARQLARSGLVLRVMAVTLASRRRPLSGARAKHPQPCPRPPRPCLRRKGGTARAASARGMACS